MVEPPLPFGNAVSRWYYVLLKGLVDRGHEVVAFATCGTPAEAEEAVALFPAPKYDLRCYVHPNVRQSFSLKGLRGKWEAWLRPYSYVVTPHLRDDFRREAASGFDVLHLEALWSGWLGLEYTERAVLNLHYLFSIDLAGRPATSLADRLRRYRTQRAEQYLLRGYHTLCTVSPRLSESVRTVNPAADVHTVPLGLDLSLYPFNEADCSSSAPVLGLIGSFHWQPTYSAGIRLLTRLWPEIKRRVPAARLQVVGRRARAALADFADSPDVEIHEDVPDIIPYFLDTSVLLYAPTRGSGMKVKILEAFALGVPVVTTSEGVEGIPAVDGIHAGISEGDAGLIERAVALLNDTELQQTRRRAARELVDAHCSPGVVLDQLENIYAGVTGASPLQEVPARPGAR